jgi:hypothetical protein
MQKECAGYQEIPPHMVEWDRWNFPAWALKPERAVPGKIIRCTTCDKYRRTKQPPVYDPIGGQLFRRAYPLGGTPSMNAPLPKTIVTSNTSSPPVPPIGAEPEEEEEPLDIDELEALKPPPAPPEPEPVIEFTELQFTTEDGDAAPIVAPDEVSDMAEPLTKNHRYVLDKDLESLWHALVTNTLKHGRDPANLIFFGPSGSGKTTGAEHLAELVSLPFTKVDAASMTDPESWFGTREIVVENGIAITKYIPSNLVRAIQQPGVVFIDEMNRVDDEHRNVWLPLTDGTGVVTNPLTGEYLQRHPHCFIIMAGNRGLQFTGTSAVDPAFTSRAYVVEFKYISEADEKEIVMEETGCDEATATVFTRFAADTRDKAAANPEFIPISTREVMRACEAVHGGLDRDLAAAFAVMNAISSEGGDASVREELQSIWNGVRITMQELDDDTGDIDLDTGWKCPTHGKFHVVQAGVSKKTGKPYNAFRACTESFCDETEGRKTRASAGAKTCTACGLNQPPGVNTFCTSCGAALP